MMYQLNIEQCNIGNVTVVVVVTRKLWWALLGDNRKFITCSMTYNTHTHNRVTAALEYVQVHPGQQVRERWNQENTYNCSVKLHSRSPKLSFAFVFQEMYAYHENVLRCNSRHTDSVRCVTYCIRLPCSIALYYCTKCYIFRIATVKVVFSIMRRLN